MDREPYCIVMINGRIWVYCVITILLKQADVDTPKAIRRVIGERPRAGHNNSSVYLATSNVQLWRDQVVNHHVGCVLSSIPDTATTAKMAIKMTARLL